MFPPNGKPPGVMIAAARSGAGKTTVTLGLLRALARRGLAVQPFKCGPDYIDPAFHEAACGRSSYNLDSWAMRKGVVRSLLNAATGADFVVIEALMGLFDGVSSAGSFGNGSSASIAALTGWPVLLVLDVSGQSQSAAAVARGFQNFSPGVEIAGAILNRVASARHERLVRAEFERIGMPIFGAFRRNDAVAFSERHLGLVQASEISGLERRLEELADLAEQCIDIESLVNALSAGPQPGETSPYQEDKPFTLGEIAKAKVNFDPPGQKIAVARDAAFSFLYPHVVAGWRDNGAELIPFSPLNDEAPDAGADVLWLPGGYPELYAGRLACNFRFLDGVRSFAASKPVHGECGGYMVLGDGIVDAARERHVMLGLLRLDTSFAERKLNLGYRRAKLLLQCVLGAAGKVVRGHEFHYAVMLREQGESLFEVSDADGNPLKAGGLRNGNVTGSFFHFVDKCE